MELDVDGRKVFAATGGKKFDAADPTVMFIHGSGGDHTVWALQTRYFAWHGRGVLAVDLPGHGRSDGPALTAVGEIADWAGRLLDAAGVAKAAVVGHSLGALAALEMAARLPERVSAAALLGVVENMKVHPDLLQAARDDDHLAIELMTAWGLARRSHLGGQRTPGLWMAGGNTRLLERGAAGILDVDFTACDAFEGAASAAARIACPVLFVLGVNDRMTAPRGAAPLAEKIADARTVLVPDAGHMMMVEQPDRTLDALREFV